MAVQGCITGETGSHVTGRLPHWVPQGARLYLSHIATGQSLRAIAREQGCHASTILRQVRRFENRRDDPLIDNALRKLDLSMRTRTNSKPSFRSQQDTEPKSMLPQPRKLPEPLINAEVEDQAMRYLRDLTGRGALLIVAADMPKAVITREDADGVAQRVAVFDRHLAEAMALLDWITCRNRGRVSSYVISPTGRVALRNHLGAEAGDLARQGENDDCAPRRMRYGVVESPVAVLARRRDKSGKPFLETRQVHAAERLREDFVMAQLDSIEWASAQDLLRALESRKVPGPNIAPPGTAAARKRVLDVFRDLGPGLGDVALRCCCRLEGVESAENAMGWSARSGKIVLRIALQRLSRQYHHLGDDQMMIG
ncbi:MAG: helix-turn-helix domain-containing protein [Natronohydrobacter sp.]|nr:helix-turn-helix domain-containing protein [Natronohydrobacter sp.]